MHGSFVGLDDRRWWVRNLWESARELPVMDVRVDQLRELDEDCWFSGDGRVPTVRAVADHARLIEAADLSAPILLAADGRVLDGMHRIAKAHLLGVEQLPARRFDVDPEPDWLDKQG